MPILRALSASFTRIPVPNLDILGRMFRPGKAEVAREGSDLAILACGTAVHLAVAAADLLQPEGISARVLNFSTINPLDEADLQRPAGQSFRRVNRLSSHATTFGQPVW